MPAVITRALITPNHWHPGSIRMTTRTSKTRRALAVTHLLNQAIIF